MTTIPDDVRSLAERIVSHCQGTPPREAYAIVERLLLADRAARDGGLREASLSVGKWMSAALDDPDVCDEMKADINEWFNAFGPPLAASPAPEGWTMTRARWKVQCKDDEGKTFTTYTSEPEAVEYYRKRGWLVTLHDVLPAAPKEGI